MTTAGQVLAWGNNDFGQLGNGTTTDSSVPVSVSLPPGSTVTSVAGGADHSLAVTTAGQVLAWGNNGSGRLGNGNNINSDVPVFASLPPGITVTAVAAGSSSGDHSLALTSAGQVLAWGAGSEGQLGNGASADSNVPVPVTLPLGATVSAIAAGAAHSLAVVAADVTIAKTADVQSFANPGDVITYTYDVANIGVSQVNNTVVSDSILPGGTACVLGTFAPGDTATCQASYPATAADVANHEVTNSAIAAGSLSGGMPVQSNRVSLTIPLIEHPAIAIQKTADVTSYALAGDVIRYAYTVTNDGDVPLHNVTVDDSKLLGAQVCQFQRGPGRWICTPAPSFTPSPPPT